MPARKAHHEEEHGSAERWLLTYADLITLLMVFFVVMYAMSKADVSKFAKLQTALQRAFNVDVLQGVDPTSLLGNDSGSAFVAPLQQESVFKPSSAVLDSRTITTAEEVRRALAQGPLPDGVLIGTAPDGVLVSISGNALFDSGKADLKPAGLAVLDVLANQLRPTTNQVRVEGHTDNIPITTPLFPSNWELSAARATTVVRYLIERGGIAPQKLIAAGYGDQRPIASNDTRDGRARNRRVDLIILTPRSAASQPAPESLPNLGALP